MSAREYRAPANFLSSPYWRRLARSRPNTSSKSISTSTWKSASKTTHKAGNKRAVTKLKNPPRETMIHAAIYKARPEVNSVVHTHQTIATAFSVAGTPILPIYNQAAVFAPETPIFPSPRLIYTVQDGKEICQTLGDRIAMLLKGHGIVVCGDSLEYATIHAIYLERTAYMQFIASCVGKPAIMPQVRNRLHERKYDVSLLRCFCLFQIVVAQRRAALGSISFNIWRMDPMAKREEKVTESTTKKTDPRSARVASAGRRVGRSGSRQRMR